MSSTHRPWGSNEKLVPRFTSYMLEDDSIVTYEKLRISDIEEFNELYEKNKDKNEEECES